MSARRLGRHAMQSVFQTFYVSRASNPFDDVAVKSILHVSRKNNARTNITGCLLFSGRCFAQVLEGEESTVRALTERITGDARHGPIQILSQCRRRERAYPDWAMGYLHDLNLEDDLEMLLMIPGRSPVVVAEVMERMRPDPVIGAMR